MRTAPLGVLHPGAVCIEEICPPDAGAAHHPMLGPSPGLRLRARRERWRFRRFRRAYGAERDFLDARRVGDELELLGAPYEPVIVSRGAPGGFAPRRVLARWLERELDVRVPEVDVFGAEILAPVIPLFGGREREAGGAGC